MDNQRVPLLNWAYFCQGKSIDELRQSLLLTTMELENTRLKAQAELKMRDELLIQLKDSLSRTITERDEAQEKYQRLLLEKLVLQQQQQQQQQLQLQLHQQYKQSAPLSGISSIEDEPKRGLDSNNGFSSSDCEESIVSSPVAERIPPPKMPQAPPRGPVEPEPDLPILPDGPLPEKGKLLQAVMKAGPLLQTLLLAGPLPQWRHPPPPLDTYQIPQPPLVIPSPPPPPAPTSTPTPTLALAAHNSLQQDSFIAIAAYNSSINNCGRLNRKRGFSDCSDSSTETKYQRLVLQ